MTDTRTAEALERIADTLDDLVDVGLGSAPLDLDLKRAIRERRAGRAELRQHMRQAWARLEEDKGK